MSAGLVLILVVGAYVAAHLASEWLARRYLIVSGAEYLLLGIPARPAGLRHDHAHDGGRLRAVHDARVRLDRRAGRRAVPRLPELLRIPRVMYRVAWVEAVE